jgi:hypothetical protein
VSALALPALALANRAVAALPCLFAELGDRAPPVDTALLSTAGHSAPGRGGATYVDDPLAEDTLLEAHYRFVARTANGRIFRLLPQDGVVTVEQGGAVGDGLADDRPAIQAAIDYAEAVGAAAVHFASERYRLHCPVRTSPADDVRATDGHPLVVRRSLALRGRAAGQTTLDFRGLGGSDPEAAWQTVRQSANDPSDAVWRGGGLFLLGEESDPGDEARRIARFELDRMVLKGNRRRTGRYQWPADPADGDGWDVTDKAIWLQDSFAGTIVLSDVACIGWKGEIVYFGGAANAVHAVELTRCRFLTGNGNAWNPGPDIKVTGRDCEFGDCFQAQEDIAKTDATYHRCVWRDCEFTGIGGGPAGAGYNAVYPVRDADGVLPSTRLIDCEFRNVRHLQFGSWVTGRIRTIDSPVVVDGNHSQAAKDIDLAIDAVLDKAELLTALTLYGPPTLNEAVPGAPAGVFKKPPTQARFRVRHYRSELAVSQNRQWRSALWTGHIDPSCRIVCEGDLASQTVPNGGNQPLAMPYVACTTAMPSTMYVAHGFYNHPPLTQSGEIMVTSPLAVLALEAEMDVDCTLARWPAAGPAFGYAPGQKVRFVKDYAQGRIRFLKAANSFSQAVTQDRVLDAAQDWIEFTYNYGLRRWEESAFFSSA